MCTYEGSGRLLIESGSPSSTKIASTYTTCVYHKAESHDLQINTHSSAKRHRLLSKHVTSSKLLVHNGVIFYDCVQDKINCRCRLPVSQAGARLRPCLLALSGCPTGLVLERVSSASSQLSHLPYVKNSMDIRLSTVSCLSMQPLVHLLHASQDLSSVK